MHSFAQALAAEMRRQHLSTAALAAKTGIHERLIRRYKSGKVIPQDYWRAPTENAYIIADALGVTVDELFDNGGKVAA